ncbi:MAG: agmatinase [Bacteroidetes bacterium]|nr:agmatinase [Bacteroidota bacterium]
MFNTLPADEGFLALPEADLASFEKARVAIQQVPYEHTSSYISGSDKGPAAIVSASHFVEFYDEELDQETYKDLGICTLAPIDFTGKVDEAAVKAIEEQTRALLNAGKYVVSLGAEHTVTLGFVRAFREKYPDLSVIQIDAHSDLRLSYHDNPYSHASVMARVHDLGVNLVQVGIRAQCVEESQLIKSSDNIHTWYAHQLWNNDAWIDASIDKLGDHVYLTIDADGFDPSVCPAVGTAEPGGLTWIQGCKLLRRLAERKKVVGFDIVEIAPRETDIITEFSMAKLCYKILGYLHINQRI